MIVFLAFRAAAAGALYSRVLFWLFFGCAMGTWLIVGITAAVLAREASTLGPHHKNQQQQHRNAPPGEEDDEADLYRFDDAEIGNPLRENARKHELLTVIAFVVAALPIAGVYYNRPECFSIPVETRMQT